MNRLEQLSQAVQENWKKSKMLEEQAQEYCKNKRFRIVKNVFYSGFQKNLKGRECVLKPCVNNGKLLFSCVIYNKRTKRIDIDHKYYYPLSFYEEIK